MLKNYILAATLLIPSLVFSQSRQGWHIDPKGFAVKTDLLSIFNSTIHHGFKSCSVSGEIYLNDIYSFNIDLVAETEIENGWNRTEKRFGSHVRWYFLQDDCNCSAFFVGSYFSMVKIRQDVDQQLLHNNAVNYSRSSVEGGLCGGYQALLANHFVIDPGMQMGIEFQHEMDNTESMSSLSDAHNRGLLLRVSLGIGYRF